MLLIFRFPTSGISSSTAFSRSQHKSHLQPEFDENDGDGDELRNDDGDSNGFTNGDSEGSSDSDGEGSSDSDGDGFGDCDGDGVSDSDGLVNMIMVMNLMGWKACFWMRIPFQVTCLHLYTQELLFQYVLRIVPS